MKNIIKRPSLYLPGIYAALILCYLFLNSSCSGLVGFCHSPFSIEYLLLPGIWLMVFLSDIPIIGEDIGMLAFIIVPIAIAFLLFKLGKMIEKKNNRVDYGKAE